MNDNDIIEQNQKHLLVDTRIQKEIERKPIGDRSADPASQPLLSKAAKEGIETAWDRYEAQQTQCGFGELGICCRICLMGPCRIDPLENGPQKGVCGATTDIIVARNLLRMIAAGAAAHSEHGREVTEVLHLVSQGKMAGYEVKDEKKLSSLAAEFCIEVQQAKSEVQAKSKEEIARDVAEAILDEFGTRKGCIKFRGVSTSLKLVVFHLLFFYKSRDLSVRLVPLAYGREVLLLWKFAC